MKKASMKKIRFLITHKLRIPKEVEAIISILRQKTISMDVDLLNCRYYTVFPQNTFLLMKWLWVKIAHGCSVSSGEVARW